MVTDFRDYEARLGREAVLPLLARLGIRLEGMSVLDVGCGYGGVLAALAGRFPLRRAQGIDLDAGMIAAGRARFPEIDLRQADFLSLPGGSYDLILMRDVLEHIVDVEGALAKAATMLNPGGFIYATFAPFPGPFGGHQHNGAGLFARLPWIHFLPEKAFRRLLRFPGNSYKEGAALEADMESVLRTRLTLARFRRAAAGLKVRHLALYLVRPDYRIKFGLPAVRLPAIPVARELLATGVEAVLTKG